MPETTNDEKEIIKQKLEYIGLDLENIPEFLREFKPLNFRPLESYNEAYKVYKYIDIEEIQILITPTDRLTNLKEKYKLSASISEYLDTEQEENIEKFVKFLELLKNFKIDDVKEIEDEQKLLKSKIPFEVKYKNNFIWQIYYSDYNDRYFMLVPSKEMNNPELFYILKKQIECKKNNVKEKIFVPISHLDYSGRYLKKSEISDVENYLWYFTKQWPDVFEVYDNKEKLYVQIIGQIDVYEKVLSTYRIVLKDKEAAVNFYKLLKALFILSTGAEEQYKFNLKINKEAGIDFFFEQEKIEYIKLPNFINNQVNKKIKDIENVKLEIVEKTAKLQKLKKINESKIEEYLEKQKQISTFLECKKTFLGRVRYYFKSKNIKKQINNNEENIKEDKKQEPEVLYERKEQYTLEDLIGLCTRLNNKNEENKNKQLDIKAIELKITNLSKKIENAELYIKEIEKHKKSIFEFWKFTNKDELPSLQEGDIEEESHKEKIEKYFDYEEDIEDFGKKADELQRRKLFKNETDAVFAVKQAMNSIKALDSDSEDLKQEFDLLKKEYEKNIEYINMKDFNIFGSMVEDKTKIKVINNKKHREIEKDKYKILNINSNSDVNLYKDNLKNYLKLINEAFGKISLCRNISVYKLSKEELCKLEIFDINPKNELQNVKNKEVMYKLNLQEGTPILYYSNIIFYENFNKTLPLGMNLSTQILLDIDKLEFELIKESEFNINIQKNQFDFEIKKVKVKEYNVKGKNKE